MWFYALVHPLDWTNSFMSGQISLNLPKNAKQTQTWPTKNAKQTQISINNKKLKKQ